MNNWLSGSKCLNWGEMNCALGTAGNDGSVDIGVVDVVGGEVMRKSQKIHRKRHLLVLEFSLQMNIFC